MNYTVKSALESLKGLVNPNGKTIEVIGRLGIKKLGAIDFLKKNGYSVIWRR